MKLRKVKNTCLTIASSVRLSSYRRRIQKLRNKRDKTNKRDKQRSCAQTTSKDTGGSEIRSDGNVTNIQP